ncbi:sialate O-acetylesterase [Maribacter sp. SA7]|uniref:sialate O-acetylesterase n=1 Tax=Maribacter zhoushanensis TaxID=3030012 RepID=UPI0023EAE729|nr:sialate O-acetylesterase [Maribacter zhoushanensis]MDF4204294.1 sialate O-acetylesterase [Maribacter zhoushanensis]
MNIRFTLILLCLVVTTFTKAEITLPKIFSNEMVLQRESNVLLYGWADPNEEFTIYTSWNDETVQVKAGNDAKWEITVKTPEAGGPFKISFTGKNNEITLQDVLIGEVWLCSGQSNMEWSANSKIANRDFEVENANYPNIRLFTVAKRTADYPQEDTAGSWTSCSSETMQDFSAVAYFFARKLQKEMNIPIGLIDNAWGASSAEVWTPESVFKAHPELVEAHKKLEPNKWVTVQKSSLFNGMVAPLTKFKIGGAIYYQGEANTPNAESYQELFTNMITSWRKEWKDDFPFYYVQIAPFKYDQEFAGGIVRDQQRRTLALEDTGMAMTSDICTTEDIHPLNKQDVGLRLANIALKNHYGLLANTEVYGPLYESFEVDGNQLKVKFTHADGLYNKGKKITLFEVSNAAGEWFAAKAKLKNGEVLLTSSEVKKPTGVRYAWRSTDIATLFNKAGLPASTFTSK